MNPEFGDLIYGYSRAQAIEDGVLVDVTKTAREAGFKFPVAMTRAAFERCVAVPPGVVGQDEEGRLWDVLSMLRFAIKAPGAASESVLLFKLHVRSDNRDCTPPLVTLKSVCGPGDTLEPVITIMMPDED